MNFSTIVQLPQGQAPLLTSAGIKKLCQPVRQQLPLQFRVVSTTVKKDFVVYNCGVSSVTTNCSWRVSYRYSDFAAFSKKVEDHFTCKNDKCSGSCETIRELLWACFPKKRLSVLSRSAHTIADRASKFETIVQYLLRCILLPGSAMKCLHLRRNLPTSLFQFLGVLKAADKRSLLQVFVDNCQGASPKCGEPALRDSFHSDASTADSIEATDCMICLESVDLEQSDEGCCDEPDSSIVLPCQHAFHRECIFEWLLFQFHCPVCRARVGPPEAFIIMNQNYLPISVPRLPLSSTGSIAPMKGVLLGPGRLGGYVSFNGRVEKWLKTPPSEQAHISRADQRLDRL